MSGPLRRECAPRLRRPLRPRRRSRHARLGAVASCARRLHRVRAARIVRAPPASCAPRARCRLRRMPGPPRRARAARTLSPASTIQCSARSRDAHAAFGVWRCRVRCTWRVEAAGVGSLPSANSARRLSLVHSATAALERGARGRGPREHTRAYDVRATGASTRRRAWSRGWHAQGRACEPSRWMASRNRAELPPNLGLHSDALHAPAPRRPKLSMPELTPGAGRCVMSAPHAPPRAARKPSSRPPYSARRGRRCRIVALKLARRVAVVAPLGQGSARSSRPGTRTALEPPTHLLMLAARPHVLA
jgi:hypothetical protein